MKCCQISCLTRNNRNPKVPGYHIGHYEFPDKDAEPARFQAWIDATGLPEKMLPNRPTLCGLHFTDADLNEEQLLRYRLSQPSTSSKVPRINLKKGSVPTIGIASNSTENMDIDTSQDTCCSLPSDCLEDPDIEPPCKILKPSDIPLTSDKNAAASSNLNQSFISSFSGVVVKDKSLYIKSREVEVQCDLGEETLVNRNKIISELASSDQSSEHNTSTTYSDSDDNNLDPDYCEESDEEEISDNDFEEDCKFEWVNNLEYEYVLVHKNMLYKLFTQCPECHSPVTESSVRTVGSMIIIDTICINNHKKTWRSQELYKDMPLGNVALTSAIFLSGMHLSTFVRFMKTLRIRGIGTNTYYRNVNRYVQPVIRHSWVEQRTEIINEINEECRLQNSGVQLISDGRYDSPGKCAYEHTYNVQNAKNGKVVDFIVMKKDPNGNGDMETACCDITFGRLVDELVGVDVLCTDRNPSVIKLLRTKYNDVCHAYDLWHVAKSFKKRYNAATKKRGMKKLGLWKYQIIGHLWWCCANCDNDGEKLVEMFDSLLKHVCNEHKWSDGVYTTGCSHGELQNDDSDAYFVEGTPEYEALKGLVRDPAFVRDLKHCYHNIHTGSVESFHSLINLYLPKRVSFSHDGVIDRCILAVLDNNFNTGRTVLRETLIYSKQSQRWVWRNDYEPKSDVWREQLHAKIVDIENIPAEDTYKKEIDRLFYVVNVPASSAKVPKPEPENLPARRSRFRDDTE